MLSFQEMMVPIWDTDTVYGESLMMLKENGEACAPLLYPPKKVLEVTNARYDTAYEEGRDWVLRDGKFYLTPDSRIFSFTPEDLYPAEPIPNMGSFPKGGGGNILFGENSFFHDRQLCLTYTCERGGWHGVTPVYAGKVLSRTAKRLKDGKGLRAVLFGDSISWGANASKTSSVSPYQPSYGELFFENLSRTYGSNIHFTNSAIGGVESEWGIRYADRMVNEYNPHLVVLAFGMNDGGKTVEQFEANLRAIIGKLRSHNRKVEIILIATSTPNPLLTDPAAKFWGNQNIFKQALDHIAADPALEGGIAVADITGMQRELHSHKRFIDTTGNHVNHPNDFFHRCYAQYLSGMLIK